MDVDAARALFRIAEEKGLLLTVNLQTRHHPAVGMIRGWLGDGLLGRVVAARASIAFGPEDLVGWRSIPELAGAAALYNLGIHAIDTVLALLDESPVAVSCLLEPRGAPLDRSASVTVRFASGAVATIFASQELSDDDVRIEILGTEGRVTWDSWLAPYRHGSLELHGADGSRSAADVPCPDAYERVVRDFTDAVLMGGSPTPTPHDAIQTVSVTEAARRAARLESIVNLGRESRRGRRSVTGSSRTGLSL
jgi:predicted dehydrogenase